MLEQGNQATNSIDLGMQRLPSLGTADYLKDSSFL
jgi:hypothetical protein